MIFSPQVFQNLTQKEKEKLVSYTPKPEKEYLEELHSVVSVITHKTKFLILIDDFNLFDSFVQELIRDLVPIFQINGLKVIISEASDFDYVSDNMNNVREIQVGSFTESQLTEYLQLAYFNKFPTEEIKNLILEFADLLPGNIINFLKDLITLQILVYNKDGLQVSENHDKLSEIEGSLGAIYDLRLSHLSTVELNIVKAISSFEGSLDNETLSKLLRIDLSELSKIFAKLQFNNVILPFTANPVPVIVTDGLKKHIYSLIDNKPAFHKQLADSIAKDLPGFNRAEFARQYELANDFESALLIWNEEINSAFELAAFSYAKNLLNHLLELPLPLISKNDLKYRLVETLYKLSDHNSTLDTIEDINIELLTDIDILELYIIKGSSLVGTGKLEEGKELIESLIPKVKSESRKNTLFVEIAYAVFDLNDFDNAVKLCQETLLRPEVSYEDKGRIHNLLGMCNYYKENDFKSALSEFQKALEYYTKVGLKNKIAAIEVNIGVMYNIIGDKKNAEASWSRALELNRAVGNISQEGVLLLNNGAYYFDELNFDKAIEYYKRAYNIFLSLGSKVNEGIALSNLGEVYFTTCDYQNCFETLEEAKILFEELENIEELIPVLVLLCHFYFTVGDYKQIEYLYESVMSSIERSQLHEKYENQLLLIRNLMLIAAGKEIEISDLECIRDNYLEKEDLKNYVTVNTILLNYLIKLELLAKAAEELNSKAFIEVSEQNNIFKANREYLLGIVSSRHITDNTLSSIEHFEKAYELLADESIVELTWKVLYSLAVEYSKRGNINKAKDFIMYSRDLLYLIAENIESTNFKTAYLQKDERRKSIEQLEKLQEA
jgi:tetratricopeptide (TPR) repeat protein